LQIDEKILRTLAYERSNDVLNASEEVYIDEPISYPYPRTSLPCQYGYISISGLIDGIYGPHEYEIIKAKISKLTSIDKHDLINVLKFDERAFQNLLRNYWSSVVDFWRIYNGDDALVSKKVNTLTELLKTNAIVPYEKLLFREYFKINVKAIELFKNHLDALANEITKNVGNLDNVIIAPILRDKLQDLENLRRKIIITFFAEEREVGKSQEKKFYVEEEYDINEKILKENIVILLSPFELGYFQNDKDETAFEEVREYNEYNRELRAITYSCKAKQTGFYNMNVEFNAIGDVKNLDVVESRLKKAKLYKINKTEYKPLSNLK